MKALVDLQSVSSVPIATLFDEPEESSLQTSKGNRNMIDVLFRSCDVACNERMVAKEEA